MFANVHPSASIARCSMLWTSPFSLGLPRWAAMVRSIVLVLVVPVVVVKVVTSLVVADTVVVIRVVEGKRYILVVDLHDIVVGEEKEVEEEEEHHLREGITGHGLGRRILHFRKRRILTKEWGILAPRVMGFACSQMLLDCVA